MHSLRSSFALVRLVLAWFVLTMGAAGAAPLLHPVTMTVVCSESGTRLVAVDADGAEAGAQGARHTLDCPLCLPAVAPPSVLAQPLPTLAARGVAVQLVASPHIAAVPGAPMPARGPPRHS